MRRGLVGEEGGSWLGPWPVSIEAIDDILGIELSRLLRTCAAFIVVDEQCSKSQPKSGAMSTDKIQGAFTVAREISPIFLLFKLMWAGSGLQSPGYWRHRMAIKDCHVFARHSDASKCLNFENIYCSPAWQNTR
jgi:hypothetical protein